MATYTVETSPRILKALRTIPTNDQRRILDIIKALADDPRPATATKLVGEPGWRIRKGNYRIVYTIDDAERIVTITRIGDRKDIYR